MKHIAIVCENKVVYNFVCVVLYAIIYSVVHISRLSVVDADCVAVNHTYIRVVSELCYNVSCAVSDL